MTSVPSGRIQTGGRPWRKYILLAAMVLAASLVLMIPGVAGLISSHIGLALQLLISLLVLTAFCMHLFSQHKMLKEISAALVASTLYINRLEQYTFVDPQTQLFNRKYLDHLFNQQLKWLNRCGKSASLLLFEVIPDGQKLSAEDIILETAFVLRSNFRGSDYVVRNATNQFLVLLPDTTEAESQVSLDRLIDKLDQWNIENEGSEMVLLQELTSCAPGGDLWSKLWETEEKLRKVASRSRVTVISNRMGATTHLNKPAAQLPS